MATQRIGTSAPSTPLPLGAETALATITVRGTVADSPAGVLIRAEVIVTGAASATTCTLNLRYGSGTGGTSAVSQAFSVDAAATARPLVLSYIDTVGQAGATQYTITGLAAGAAQTATLTFCESQVLEPTF